MSEKIKWIEEWIKEKEGSIEDFRKNQFLYRKYDKLLDEIASKIMQWHKNGMNFAYDLENHYELLKMCGYERVLEDMYMEALAAISSVSRFQIISKTQSNEFGTCMVMEGEKEVSFEEVGCPDGTTITVRDIFFNVPARRKFLKKDQTETAYISQYIERIAISNPIWNEN